MKMFAPIAASLLLLAAPVLADPAPRVLTVTGTGEAKAVPDQARLSTGVVTQAPKASQALAANARAMNQVMAALKAAGVAEKDIQTSSFAVSPQYSGGNGPQRVVGYEVTNTVNVTVASLDKLGATIDALVGAGSNRIDGPSFSFADPASLLAKARAGAVKDAEQRALDYARAAGVTLGPILSINEGGSFTPEPMLRNAMAFRAEAAPTPIAAGEESVAANVSITWQIQ